MKKKVVIGIIWLIWMCSFSVMAAEPVKIAAIFSKTGIAETHNSPHIQLVELAVEEINHQGGLLGRPVELIIIDNKSSPIGSSIAAKKAVQLKVPAVIGASWSSHSLQIVRFQMVVDKSAMKIREGFTSHLSFSNSLRNL